MSSTDAVFAGSIPEIYDRYFGPLVFDFYAQDLARRLHGFGGSRILEIAAGTGIVTRALGRMLPPSVEIVATDLNQAMLDFAAKRPTPPNVRWQQADAQDLPFADAQFEAALCQFGVMFFPDRVASYREVRRVLKPGSPYLFSAWAALRDNELTAAISEALARLFPEDPPRFMERTPFGYADPDLIRAEIEAAGFEKVEIEAVEAASEAPSAQEAAVALCQGSPLRTEIEARAPGRLDEITGRVADDLARRFGPAPRTRMKAHVASARSPRA